MLKQAENRCKIEGILSEIDLKPTSFMKNGKNMDAIGGSIIVKVVQKISGKEKELMIPVHMFASRITNKGTPNPAYESIKKVMDEYVSIAAAGNEEQADRIRITNANIRMNEYYAQDGRLVSFPRVNASFISKIRKDECKPEATFTAQFAVGKKDEELNRNGEPTGRYRIDALLPQYGGKVDVVPLYAESEGVISAISTYWEVGDTVKANGRLDFSSTTDVTYQEVDFGEPVEQVRTINKSDLIITGGSQEPLEGDLAYADSEIRNGLAERKARLDRMKDAVESGANRIKTASAPSKKAGFDDLGF
jgi:hypothetical protein